MCTAAAAAADADAVIRPTDPESAIKYLVPNYLAGSLIGKKGATIKDVSPKKIKLVLTPGAFRCALLSLEVNQFIGRRAGPDASGERGAP